LAVKKRNPLFVIAATIITFGIYGLYWFYSTARELGEVNKSEVNPIVWTIALFIPFVGLYFLWKYAGEAEKLMSKKHSQLLLFLAGFVFFPVLQYLVQQELNKAAAA
jgi:hypothetical protein